MKHRTWWMVFVLSASIGLSQDMEAQQVVHEDGSLIDKRIADAVLNRTISVSITKMTLERALQTIAERANVTVLYRNEVIARYPKEITLKASRESLRSIFDRLFAGTTLQILPHTETRLLVVDGATSATAGTKNQDTSGTISGVVVDSATQRRIRGATVMLGETKRTTTTDENGAFSFRGVPAGNYQLLIRIFGYRQVTRPTQVTTGGTATIQVGLVAVATSLSGVVTTATGQEQRLKVPNDIVKINVDSVLQTSPVSTISELLTTRVPGAVVQKTSGAPGAPSVIRIRGTSSLSLNNDPIIIVDGVRIYSSVSNSYDANQAIRTQGAREGNRGDFGGQTLWDPNGKTLGAETRNTAPSALDQINPNSIETIEILRGPSASALYGTDAANGIIVITTKRGRAGPPQWALSTDQGMATMPGSYPLNYRRWGRTIDGRDIECIYPKDPSDLTPDSRCVASDSVVSFQALNGDRTTMFGRGNTQRYGGEVRGGSQTLTYAFNANTRNEIGYLKMPDLEVGKVERFTGHTLPSWQRRPLRSGGEDGTARINIAMNPQTDMAFTASVSRQINQQTPLSVNALITRPLDTTLASILEPQLRRKITANLTNSRFVVNGLWRPFTLVSAAADIGWERSNKSDTDILRRDDCVGRKYSSGGIGQCFYKEAGSQLPGIGDGRYGTNQATRDVVSFNARTTFNILSLGGITGPSSIGFNYSSSTNSEITAKADGLLLGSTALTGAEVVEVRDQIREYRVAGIYLDQGLTFFGLYTTNIGVRFDQGSGIGSNASQPRFPKLGFSIPILTGDKSWYGVSLFRFRTAYGQSAVQPDVTAQLRTFISDTLVLPGTQPGLIIGTIGNTRLRPERSVEFEGGFDLGLWQDRVNITFNRYQKNTRDLTIEQMLPPSVNGAVSQRMNLGNVRNVGVETSVDARIIERDAFRVAFNSNFSMNSNRLTKINKDVYSNLEFSTEVGATRNVRGYPLNGWWSRPLLAYSDLDLSGSISMNEIQLADSFVYVGTGQPKYTVNFQPSFGFFQNQLNLTAAFNYQHEMVRVNYLHAALAADMADSRRVFNDTAISLDEQAHALAGTNASRPFNVLRFQELSLSYIVPRSLTRHLRAGYMSVALQASNLRLWTAYSGKDPNVRSQTIEAPIDGGQLPQPRTWQLRVNLRR